MRMLFLLDILPKLIQFYDFVNKNTNRLLYFRHHQRATLTSTETKLSRLSKKKKKKGQTTLSEGWLTWLYKLRCLTHSQACTLILDSQFISLDLYIKVRSWFLDQNQLTTPFLYLGTLDWYCTFEPKFKMDVDTVFCLPSICVPDPRKSKNIVLSLQGHEDIQNNVEQPVRALEYPKCLFQPK